MTNGKKYTLIVDTFAELEESLYDPTSQLPCYDNLLFIFENETTIAQFSEQVDNLECKFERLNLSTSNQYNFTTRITISNMTEPVLEAFLG